MHKMLQYVSHCNKKLNIVFGKQHIHIIVLHLSFMYCLWNCFAFISRINIISGNNTEYVHQLQLCVH